MMKIKMIACLFAFLLAVVSNGQTPADMPPARDVSTFTIREIKVEGIVQTDSAALLAMSGLRVGGEVNIPGDRIAGAIQALWKQGLFTDVQIYKLGEEGDWVDLMIKVEEARQIHGIELKGVKKKWKKEVEERMAVIVQSGMAYTAHFQDLVTRQIRQFYERHALPEVDLEMNLKKVSEHQFKLVIEVSENEKQKIKSIHFSGNQKVKDRKLRRLMTGTKQKSHLWSKAILVDAAYKEDLKSLLDYYRSKGYLDAAITKDTSWVDAGNDRHIQIEINEGRRYYHRAIVWNGSSVYSETLLEKVLDIKKGAIYNPERIKEQLHAHPQGLDVSSLYMDHGYLFFRADLIEKAIEGDSIDLEIRLYEGPQAKIGKVAIKGNTRTKDMVIRREIELRPGQVFSRAAIIRSQRRLMNLGYFKPEGFQLNTDVHELRGTVDLEFVVEEKNGDRFELAGGWDPGSNSVTGTLGVSFNNFSVRDLFKRKSWNPYPQGDGQQLSLRMQSSGRQYQSYNFSFSEPWFRGQPAHLSVAGFLSRRFQDLGTDGEARYNIIGGTVNYGRRLRFWNDYLASSTSVNLQQIHLQNWASNDFLLEDGTILKNGVFNNFYIKQAFTYTTLNHPFFPTKGSFVSFSVQFTPPYSLFGKPNSNSENPADSFKWLEYHKWRFEATRHFELGKKLSLRASVKAGYLGSYGQALSPFERFHFGGGGLNRLNGITGVDPIALRGYDDEVDFPVNQNGGATLFNKYSLELRYLVLNTPASSAYVHAFAEAGNAWQGTKEYNPFDLKRSVGVGFRVQVPMLGLIGLDYGVGFDKSGIGSGNFLSRFGKLSLVIGLEPD